MSGSQSRTPKQWAMLAMLMMNRNRPVGVDSLINAARHHAVIIDTGSGFVITDLRSANGVDVAGQRIRGTATLADGDRVGICDHQFTFHQPSP